MREQDKKIAEWLGVCTHDWYKPPRFVEGHKCRRCEAYYPVTPPEVGFDVLNYTTSDPDAITLLPVLVERGYSVDLFNDGQDKWLIMVTQGQLGTDGYVEGTTISAAICNAIIQLIDKEEE